MDTDRPAKRPLPLRHDPSLARWAMAALTTAFLLGTPVAGAASISNLGFLTDAPVTHFTEADLDLLLATVNDTLDHGADGAAKHWKNPQTGNHGRIKIIKTYSQQAPRCRQAKISNVAKERNLHASNVFTLCKQPNGTWAIGQVPKAR